MAAIRFNQVDLHYDTPYCQVFSNLTLLLDTSWRTGLIGRNGQGKSTLLQLIEGKLSASSGSIESSTQTIYFTPAVISEMNCLHTIIDAIAPYRQWQKMMDALLAVPSQENLIQYGVLQEQYQLADGYSIEAKIEREFKHIGLRTDLLRRPFASLSGGERTRAMIAGLFAAEAYFPLIDEPTNHLDIAGRELLAEYLRQKPGFILVSHDRSFLDKTIDHVVSINKADVSVSQGNYSQWAQNFAQTELMQERTRTNLEKEVKQLKKAASQKRQNSTSKEAEKYAGKGQKTAAVIDKGFIGHRAAKQMKRARSIEKRVDSNLTEKQSLLKNKEKQYQLKLASNSVTKTAANSALLTIQNLSLGYHDNNTFNQLLKEVSFSLNPGDRLAIIGKNGSGKSSLLNAICGDKLPANTSLTGDIKLPAFIKYQRAYQDPIWHKGELRQTLRDNAFDETRFRQILGAFGVDSEVFDRPLETFSQGQLKKVDLARSMYTVDDAEAADFLVWDEPLNYIDIFSRQQIEDAILASQPTMIFIEHDQAFIEKIATKVIYL